MIFAPSIEAARRSLDYALDQARAMGGGEDVVEVCFQRYVDESVRAQLAWDVFVGLVRGWEFCAVSPGVDEVAASEALGARQEVDVPKLERAKLRIEKLEAELAKSRGDGSLAEVRAEQARIRGELDGLRRRGSGDPRAPKIAARIEGMVTRGEAALAAVGERLESADVNAELGAQNRELRERLAALEARAPRPQSSHRQGRVAVEGEPYVYRVTLADGTGRFDASWYEEGKRRWRRFDSLEEAVALRDEKHAEVAS